MAGRKTRIDNAYRLSIPGVLLMQGDGLDDWHQFLMGSDELMELYAAIKDELGLSS